MAGECGERDKTGWRLQITVYAREREKSFILMSEFFASFVTGRIGIPVETMGNKMDCVPRCPPPASNGDLSPLVHSSRVMEMTQNIS